MKKSVLFVVISLFLIASLSFSFAASEDTGLLTNTTTDAAASTAKIDLAYNCLSDKIKDRCSLLSLDEKIFALMANGKCQDELLAEAISQECWPASGCSIKSTAQAVIALNEQTSFDTTQAEEWLLSQTAAPGDIDWYLQIDTAEESTCTITYDGTPQTTTINDDKQFTRSAGNCLSLASGDYWLRVAPTCYGKEFQISCNKAFQTNMLYKKDSSSTFYVSESIQSASGDGTTTESVSSACFVQGGSCNYEGSLWATLVLDYKNKDITAYLPYLTTLADENNKYLPDAFLYLMTGNAEYKNNLILRQKEDQYWDEGNNNRFYDTAVALYGLKGEVTDSEQKSSTKQWLFEVQDTGDSPGCWKGSVANTGFILSAAWPRKASPSTGSCRGAGYNCLSEASCSGNILPNYYCAFPTKCCDSLPEIKSCEEQGGEVCTSGESCSGALAEATLLGVGESCCVGGTCGVQEATPVSDCEANFGTCEAFGCGDNQEEIFYDCAYGDTCCATKQDSGGSGLLWIFLLVFLILLATLGIIFRKKLRPMWDKIVSKFKKKGGPGPGMRPGFGGPRPPFGGVPGQRRVLPPNAVQPSYPRPAARQPKAMDDVLGRLKQMSK